MLKPDWLGKRHWYAMITRARECFWVCVIWTVTSTISLVPRPSKGLGTRLFNDELERIRVQCAYTLRAQWFPTRLRYVIQI